MDKDLDVKTLKGITQDSRKVEPGFLFAALPGSKEDGSAYIADAIGKGASYILAPAGTQFPSNDNVVFLTDKNPRRRLATIAAEYYGAQPETIAAVTGTNGKTSVAHFIRQIWEAKNKKAVSVGTIGIQGSGIDKALSMTTPDPVTLHQELAALVKKGVTHMAMEASSHGLDQYRLDGLKISAAGFTNLSHDHLDYHKNMKEYLAAKMRLFTELLDGVAVLNADAPEYKEIKKKCKDVISYGFKGKDLKILKLTPTAHGQDAKLKIADEEMDIHFPLVGEFQIMNALCALGLAAGNKKDLNRLAPHLENLKGVPGRLQLITGHPQGAGVYIDYAHTPDALDNILKALRPHTEGKLICLFGCGGDRDKGKRPVMGKIAARLSDSIIVTDDNPRSEDPAQIRKDILSGIKVGNVIEIADRREAIQSAIKNLQKGDVLVIAGKGHEQGQIFKDHVEEFDDAVEAKNSIQKMESEKCS